MPPARPALVPALLFVVGSLSAPSDAARWATLAAALLLACVRSIAGRPLDRVLVVAAAGLGLLHGELASLEQARQAGDAALSNPVIAPSERSWDVTLSESPKRADPHSWRIRAPGLALEVPVTREQDREMLAALRAGDRVRVWARARYREHDGTFRGTIKSARLIEPLPGDRATLHDHVQRRRDTLVRRIGEIYRDDDLAGFLAAVLLGDRTWRDEAGERRLRAAGLSHLVAISGLHVGIVAGLFLALARRAVRRPAVLWAVACSMLVGFGFMVGWAVPVQRAVAVALLALGAQAIGRDGDALNRLACVAVVLAWLVPGGLTGPAFALSFAATTGILLAGAGRLGARMSLGAYLATAPLCALFFGQLAPWAPAANLLAIPLVTLLLISGYASILLAGVPGLGAATVGIATRAYEGIQDLADGVDRLPASPWFVAPPPWWLTLAMATAGLTAALTGSARLRRATGLCFALGAVALHLGPPPRSSLLPEARLLDVGQGQALVWTAGREVTLVDAGGRGYGRWDPGAAVVRPALIDDGLRRLDRLVLSHGDADHAAGAFAVLEALEVGELWLGPGWWRDDRLAELAALARRRGAAVRLVHHGAGAPGLRVVAPARDDPLAEGNAGSIALLLGRLPWTLLAPGDLDGEALSRAIESGAIPPATALVLAHHGSRRGTTEALLRRVRPQVAVVSCGWRNRFGHPHPEALERLDRFGIPLWRTDHGGTILLRGTEQGWTTELNARRGRGTR